MELTSFQLVFSCFFPLTERLLDVDSFWRQAATGLSAKGFVFGVGLDVQGLVEFIESRTGKELEPFELSLAYGSFEFSWPSTTDCSNKEILGEDAKGGFVALVCFGMF